MARGGGSESKRRVGIGRGAREGESLREETGPQREGRGTEKEGLREGRKAQRRVSPDIGCRFIEG